MKLPQVPEYRLDISGKAKENHVPQRNTPTTRTVNGKALSANITITADDVGTMTTAQINTAISQLQTQINNLPALLSGTNEPTTETGKAGDWYIVY